MISVRAKYSKLNHLRESEGEKHPLLGGQLSAKKMFLVVIFGISV